LVKNSGGALLTVVNDILDFSKMEAGKTELAVRSFDLAHLAHGTAAIVRQSAEAKGLTLTVGTGDLAGYFLGDDGRLRQILLNLLSNAIKFTREGSVSLTIARAVEKGPNVLSFRVADTGIGIAPSDEHRLFSQFSQANSSICREHGGTGLGLAICKRLVDLMGGTIGYRRTTVGGSEFWFELDLQTSGESSAENCPAPRVPGEPLRILVAEDVEANQELVTAMLERAGHKVVIVNNGREALASVQETDFDLVLMDVQMPVMDGVTATKLIRLLPGKPRTTPIIALTANILPEQIDTFRTAGMNDHVGKPISFVELAEAIARNCSLREAGPSEDTASNSVRDTGFDRTAYSSLANMLPADRLKVHSLTLQSALLGLETFTGSKGEIKHLVHSMISQAGMFGFVRLSVLCRELENAENEGWPPNELVAAIQEAATAAQSKLNELRAAARLSA
jgi:CheY-like chemotaxis protein